MDREVAKLRAIQEAWRARTALASDLRVVAETTVTVAKKWDDLGDSKKKLESRVGQATEKLNQARSEVEAASPDRVEKLSKKVREAEAEFERMRAELSRCVDDEARVEASFSELAAKRLGVISELGRLKATPYAIDAGPPESPSVTPTADVASGETDDDVLKQIEKLAELHRLGILTAEEFASKKTELLARL